MASFSMGPSTDADNFSFTQKQTVNNREYNCFMVCGSVFECPTRYRPLKPIGKGAYGIVCSALDTQTNQKVAIKKISNAFENAVDSKRTLREIKLLRHLFHENVVALRDILSPVNRAAFKDVYVVYELMDTDLHQIIRSPQPLSDDHCQYFLYQVLRGLKFIHSANILHRDLKPSNLLVNANCDLKICDFGLARSICCPGAARAQEFLTEYVVTRWYRAPELLLSSAEYTAAIDVWSVGCIFAELLGRKPLFPGKDYVQQLNLITQVLGSPSDSDLSFIQSDKARRYVRSLPTYNKKAFKDMWPHASDKALDLLNGLLQFNPSRRLSVEEALAHPYLASLHDISDEPNCSQPWTYDLDSDTITPNMVRDMILRDILAMHPDEQPSEQLQQQAMQQEQPGPVAEHMAQQQAQQQHVQQQQQCQAGPYVGNSCQYQSQQVNDAGQGLAARPESHVNSMQQGVNMAAQAHAGVYQGSQYSLAQQQQVHDQQQAQYHMQQHMYPGDAGMHQNYQQHACGGYPIVQNVPNSQGAQQYVHPSQMIPSMTQEQLYHQQAYGMHYMQAQQYHGPVGTGLPMEQAGANCEYSAASHCQPAHPAGMQAGQQQLPDTAAAAPDGIIAYVTGLAYQHAMRQQHKQQPNATLVPTSKNKDAEHTR